MLILCKEVPRLILGSLRLAWKSTEKGASELIGGIDFVAEDLCGCDDHMCTGYFKLSFYCSFLVCCCAFLILTSLLKIVSFKDLKLARFYFLSCGQKPFIH